MAGGRLFEREAAALVIRAGRAAGLIVHAEIPIPAAKLSMKGKMPTMDYGWLAPSTNKLLVAWELDGQDAQNRHIEGHVPKDKPGNVRKFSCCSAVFKIQVLYSVTNGVRGKGASRALQIAKLLPKDVRIMTDEELMAPAPDGIDQVMEIARQAAGLAILARA